jgi:hypothetical protein
MSRTSYLRRPLAALLMAVALAASVVIAAVVLASPAQAATYTVTNNADSGAGSLRQAIIDANTTTGVADTINFDLGSAATITLTSGQLPDITDGAGLTIDGGSANITISGDNKYRVFDVGAKLTLSNLTVADGGGGPGAGIRNTNGTVTLSNSTLSGNSADCAAGGIHNLSGTVTVSNSTFSGNSATLVGGGIFNNGNAMNTGTVTVSNSTFFSNSNNGGFGGGIHNEDGTATLKNTIVAKSPSASGENCVGTITNGGYNLDSGTSCGFPPQNSSKDPLLGTLTDNGGPTKTHALLAGSPAIDKGNSFGATTDQRGLPRPSNFVGIVNAGDGSDIGAFELQAPSTPPDTTPPKVTSTIPGNGGEVGPAANIKATFSEDIRPASVLNAFKLFRKGSTTQIDAQVSYDAATDIATLNPDNNPRRGAPYKAVVSTVAKHVAGNRLDQDDSTAGLQKKVWFFEID